MGEPMPRGLSPRATCATLLLAGAPLGLLAQATTVTLQGTISGSDGSTPEGAQVEVRSRETNSSRGTVVDRGGAYRVLGLAPGMYDVTVRAIGYRQQRREAVRLLFGHRAILDFMLERGALELEPTVITAARPLDVRRTDISTAVLQEEIEKLPLNSRNVLELAAIAPGVRTYAAEAGRSIPAVGSLPVAEPRFTNLYVDGVEWKGTYIGSVVGEPQKGSPIPQESVREFRVLMNPYDVEYTHGASYVISAVTHRGGNAFEGSLFGFVQNRALVARSTSQGEPEYSRYQTGANLRGPLVRDRLFFSLSYEGQVTDNFIDVVPGRPPAKPGIWDTLAGTFKAPSRVHTGLLRLTAPRRSHTLDAIWATRHILSESGFGTHSAGIMLSHDAGVGNSSRVNSVQLRDTYTSSSLVNELSIHFLDLRNHGWALRPGPTLAYPNVQVGRNLWPVLVNDRHIRAINKTSYTLNGPAGQHVLKAGVEITRARTDIYRPLNKDGFFEFATDTSTQPSRGRIGVGASDPTSTRDARGVIDGWFIGTYLQDEWKPISSLTIIGGLRYDADLNTLNQRLVAPWAGDTTLQRAFGDEFVNTGDRRNDVDNVAPRFAVAWDVSGTGRTFVRGGYGVMYDRVPVFGAGTERISAAWRVYVFQNPGTTDPAELRRRVLAGQGTSPPNLVLVKDQLDTPANHQWSVGVGHQLTDRTAANLDYVGQRVKNTYVTVTANRLVGGRRPITNRYGDITLWDDFGDARFRALLASVTYDQPRVRLNVAYTLGWAESEFGDFTTSGYPDSASYAMQQSEGDERHRLVVSGLTQLPLGLALSGIAIIASPRPFFVTVGTDVNQNGTRIDDWPNGVRTHHRDGWDHWYRTVDLRLGRSFPIPGGRLSVTAEVFNAFSWGNHSEYEATQSSLSYGEPIGDYARRQAQLGVRYQF
ncbi:MAG TPA: carboxypeptidase regulatory-like domain-containing protein [Gemmatimonadaceae bacterium]|nr:carboxypeptidase regulatory-like domain-containing protein [Gemmatimonadaceae bacterium]